MASNVKSNAEDYINKLYDHAHDTQKQQLMDAYNVNNSTIDTQKQNTQQQAQEYTDRANVEVQKVAQAYKPASVSSNINSQVALATENQQKNNVAAINNQQQAANAEYERLRKLYADQYTAAIKQAQADNDMARAQQLYEAAKQTESQLKAFSSQMGTLDNEALINQIYNSATESQRQQLAAQQAQTMSELEAQQAANQRTTDQNLTQTYVDALKKSKNYNEVQNAYGLGSGNMAQAQLARDLGLASDLTELRRLQMASDAQLGASRVQAQKSYADTLADAVKASEQARAEAMYKEALTQPAKSSSSSSRSSGTGAGTGGTGDGDYNKIKEVQKMLNEQGANLAVDGIFGEETRKAYAQYVSDNMKENYTLTNSRNDEKIRIEGVTGKEGVTYSELEDLVREDKVEEVVDPARKTITYVATKK